MLNEFKRSQKLMEISTHIFRFSFSHPSPCYTPILDLWDLNPNSCKMKGPKNSPPLLYSHLTPKVAMTR